MKLKKIPKLIIAIVALLLIIALAVVIILSFKPDEKKVTEVKVLKSIDEYGYQLKDNKTEKYKVLFKELEDILRADTVDEEAYAKKVAEMFVYDFFSFFFSGAPATMITISPFGSCSRYHAATSARVPRLCSSNFFEISRATEHSLSEPKNSANCSRASRRI